MNNFDALTFGKLHLIMDFDVGSWVLMEEMKKCLFDPKI
jgi:hypothetical protein